MEKFICIKNITIRKDWDMMEWTFVLHKIYDCIEDSNNGYDYVVIIENDKYVDSLNKKVFDKNFMKLSEYRKGKINEILS